MIQILKSIINNLLSKIGLELRRKRKIIKTDQRIDDILNLEHRVLNFKDELILVYQMGKVASSTICRSLEKCGLRPFQFHHLNDKTSLQLEEMIKHDYVSTSYIEEILRGNLRSKFLLNRIFLNEKSNLKKIKIITLAREPVGYLISAFFQNYPSFFSNYIKYENEKYGLKNIEKLKKYFLGCVNEYLQNFGNYNQKHDNYYEVWRDIKRSDLKHFFFLCQWPLIWFDRELKSVFNFDVYNSSFDKKLGFGYYKSDDSNKLVIKFERFKDIGKKVISDLINNQNFKIVNENVGIEKEYSELYRQFTSSISLPKKFIELQYKSRYAQFFYTKKELDSFTKKWAKFDYKLKS